MPRSGSTGFAAQRLYRFCRAAALPGLPLIVRARAELSASLSPDSSTFCGMRAEVVNFEWPDFEHSGAEPRDARTTSLVLIARPLGRQGGETFQINVCTPDGLTDLLARDGALIGRHFLFVPVVDIERVESLIRDRLRRLDGDSWNELAEKIGRIGCWEFEDYTERS